MYARPNSSYSTSGLTPPSASRIDSHLPRYSTGSGGTMTASGQLPRACRTVIPPRTPPPPPRPPPTPPPSAGAGGAGGHALRLPRVADDQRAARQRGIALHLHGARKARNRYKSDPQRACPTAPGGVGAKAIVAQVFWGLSRGGAGLAAAPDAASPGINLRDCRCRRLGHPCRHLQAPSAGGGRAP